MSEFNKESKLKFDFDIRKCIEENSVKSPPWGETRTKWIVDPIYDLTPPLNYEKMLESIMDEFAEKMRRESEITFIPVTWNELMRRPIYSPYIPLQVSAVEPKLYPGIPKKSVFFFDIEEHLLPEGDDSDLDCLGMNKHQADEFDAMCQARDDYFWPHKNGCPACGSDAYVGFAKVECSMSTCQNFVWKAGM